jgi:hypothetical protein
MTDETTGAAQPQAGEATQPQAGAGSPSQAEGAQKAQAAGAAAESGTEGSADFSALQRENAELRKEQAANRRKLQDFEKAQQAAQQASMSDLEKAQARVAELEREREVSARQQQEQSLRVVTVSTAARLGFADPEDAFRLLDPALVEYGTDGAATNVGKLLDELLKAKPYLAAAQARPDYGGGNRGRVTLTLDEIKKMTPEEAARRMPEIDEAIARANA